MTDVVNPPPLAWAALLVAAAVLATPWDWDRDSPSTTDSQDATTDTTNGHAEHNQPKPEQTATTDTNDSGATTDDGATPDATTDDGATPDATTDDGATADDGATTDSRPNLEIATFDLDWGLNSKRNHWRGAKDPNNWKVRVASYVSTIKKIKPDPDFIALQEVGGQEEVDDILQALNASQPQYCGNAKPSPFYQKTAIIYQCRDSDAVISTKLVPDEPKVLTLEFARDGLDIAFVALQFSQLQPSLPESQIHYLLDNIKISFGKSTLDLVIVAGNLQNPSETESATNIHTAITSANCDILARNGQHDIIFVCRKSAAAPGTTAQSSSAEPPEEGRAILSTTVPLHESSTP